MFFRGVNLDTAKTEKVESCWFQQIKIQLSRHPDWKLLISANQNPKVESCWSQQLKIQMENCYHRYQFSNKNIQKTESNTSGSPDQAGGLNSKNFDCRFPKQVRFLPASEIDTFQKGDPPQGWVSCDLSRHVEGNMQHFILAVLCASCCSHVTPCNTLQHTATHHISLQHTAKHTATLEYVDIAHTSPPVEITTKLQFCTATHCNTLLHTRQHT